MAEIVGKGGLALIVLLATQPLRAQVVPAVPADCRQTLTARGARFREWPVRPEKLAGKPLCEVPVGVRVLRTPSRIRYQKPPRVNCAFALRLLRFEEVVQELARRLFAQPVARIEHLGTYSCRRMAAYPDLVSEHSFANAIDVKTFVLRNGRRIDVEKDFAPKGAPAEGKPAQFLRQLARRLYDDKVFTVVLTPNYDRHHRNHFHLDGAPYTVDGT
jgi:hypothetical protein